MKGLKFVLLGCFLLGASTGITGGFVVGKGLVVDDVIQVSRQIDRNLGYGKYENVIDMDLLASLISRMNVFEKANLPEPFGTAIVTALDMKMRALITIPEGIPEPKDDDILVLVDAVVWPKLSEDSKMMLLVGALLRDQRVSERVITKFVWHLMGAIEHPR